MQANTVQSQTKLFLFSKISISKEFGIHIEISKNPKLANIAWSRTPRRLTLLGVTN